MAYPPKITPAQWDDIERRASAGESTASLAREYGVSESALRKRGISSQRCGKVREVAQRLAAAHAEVATLPPRAQHLAVSLAEELRAISSNLAQAARYGSATAQRLAQAAHDQVEHAEVLDEGTLRSVAMVTRTANEAGQLGVQLLKANEDTMRESAERERRAKSEVTAIRLVPMVADP